MPFDFIFPDVGEGIQEGEIVKWLVKEGDVVKEDQALVQIETDKAVVDLPSPKSGAILKINFSEGKKVKVGESLVQIGNNVEKIEIKKNKIEDKKIKETSSKKGQSVVGELEEAEEQEIVKEVIRTPSVSSKILASPALRKIAHDNNIDLTNIRGSGEDGRILQSDLKINLSNSSPLKGIRKTIAEAMMRSLHNTAQVTIMDDIDITEIWKIRDKENKKLMKKKKKLTYMPFIIKAVISALHDVPVINSKLDNEGIQKLKQINIGIAADSEHGLFVPVIKNAEHKSILELADEIMILANKVKERKISLEEMKESTFTLTNYGSVGGKYATPILNSNEAGALGIGKIFDAAVPIKNKVRIRKILPLSLTFDHRILDGGDAARFMLQLKNFLEDPDNLLMEIR
ncbi:2-oxo acid dehydrogenase subunit E2 [Candidatus Pacearchaeota archaeon]|nr:2-oxo acid dehydrogenase subunit E2 [Candidatus Pacearchaeota archaeon]